jgi:methionyl-tRNA formyltransferase
MRVLFAGSPGIAVPALNAAARLSEKNKDFKLAGLLTNPDSPRGRSGKPEPTECAAAFGQFSSDPKTVLKPEKLDSAARTHVTDLKPDLLVSFAYGKIFGPKFLELFPLGGINVHPSLLPKYRGPTPIPAAIINQESETGITIQRIAAQMDSGDILAQEKIPLGGRETTASLNEIMAIKASELLPAVLMSIAAGTLQSRVQDHNAATYCALIDKGDGLIDWRLTAGEIDAKIRAFDPRPLSWTMNGDMHIFILKAESLETNDEESGHSQKLEPSVRVSFENGSKLPGCILGKCSDKGIIIQTGGGILAVSVLQYQAKKAMEWKAFLNGARNFIGTILG